MALRVRGTVVISGSLVVEYFVITRPSAIASRDRRVGDCSAELRRASGIFNCLHISFSGCQFDRGLGDRRERPLVVHAANASVLSFGVSDARLRGRPCYVGVGKGRNCMYMRASDGRPAAGGGVEERMWGISGAHRLSRRGMQQQVYCEVRCRLGRGLQHVAFLEIRRRRWCTVQGNRVACDL